MKKRVEYIISADYVLPMDEELSVISGGAVAVSGGEVAAVGPEAEIVAAFDAARRIDAPCSVLLPGLVNTHTHVPMVYFRGMADDIPLKAWLENHIWPAEGAWLGDDFCGDAAELACLEMLKAGVTCYNDMYFFGDAIARATKKIGMRGVVGAGILDFPSRSGSNTGDYLANAETLINDWKGDDLIVPCVAPHAPYTCCPESMTKARLLAEKHDVPLHAHLSETAWEVGEILSRYGKTPIELLDSIGFLSEHVVAAHCVHPTEAEIGILAKRRVGVAHCIESNLKLASGIAPVAKMLASGVRVTFGTDGAASNNDLSIFSEMSTAAKVHKAVAGDPTVLDSRTVLAMATRWGAEALGLGRVTGSLEPGKSADMIIVGLNRPHLVPLYDIYSHLAYAVNAADVNTVMVAGRIVVENRGLLTADEGEIIEKAGMWREKILEGSNVCRVDR
jgi:5-methylthioadenosine/S-adenosylhomocysteine deaminase